MFPPFFEDQRNALRPLGMVCLWSLNLDCSYGPVVETWHRLLFPRPVWAGFWVPSAVLQVAERMGFFVVNTWGRHPGVALNYAHTGVAAFSVGGGLLCLAIGMVPVALSLLQKGTGWFPGNSGVTPGHTYLVLIGGLSQCTLGVCFWIFPRFDRGRLQRQTLTLPGAVISRFKRRSRAGGSAPLLQGSMGTWAC